jgi:S-DNA-T family DNA segregation ATPase FtsK/SpoIIIE
MENENDLKKIMRSHKEQIKDMGLPIFLGYDNNNQPLIVDLAKVGNILVGGATGQGKTNLLHVFARSIYYAPPQVSNVCIDYYIDSKGCEEFSPYFDIHLNTLKDIKADIDMLQEKIVKREIDKKMSRYPIALLIDDFDHLVLMDKSIIEKIVSIAQRGPRVGIFTVLTSSRAESNILPARLRIEMPTRVAFRVATTIESRGILDSPEATLLTNKGEILFSHNLKLTRLQTINVIDNDGE